MIKEESIQRVREAADIVRTCQKFLPDLKKQGANWKAKSPFTDEKTPSFTVNPAKNIYKCFSSGKGGDSIDFLMESQRKTFYEAIQWLADEFKVDIEFTEGESISERDSREDMDKVMRSSIRLYKSLLTEESDSKKVLNERAYNDEDANYWQVGHAPADMQTLTKKVIKAEMWSIAEELGLVKNKEEKTFDAFIGRLIVPIFDINGRPVGIAGRRLPGQDEKYAKWINPKDSRLYNKSKVLYGLHQPDTQKAMRVKNKVYLVEGYMDVWAMHKMGMPNAVAMCGTALTPEQIKLIARFCKCVTICTDSDAPGTKAAGRALPALLKQDFKVMICRVPDGKDPDDLMRIAGTPEAFQRTMENSETDALMWSVGQIMSKALDADSRAAALEEIGLLLYAITKSVKRDEYIKQICSNKTWAISRAHIKETMTAIGQTEQSSGGNDEGQNKILPPWVDSEELYTNGFVQKHEPEKNYPVGIYFLNNGDVQRLTNYTVKPLFQIQMEMNGRRLIEIWNGRQRQTVEVQNKAFVGQEAFESTLIEKGAFYSEAGFGKHQYKRLMGWAVDRMPRCFELGTLGWQPEGFFAFANTTIYNNQQLHYDKLGMVQVADKYFLSPGVSSIRSEEREETNMYENDLYLKHTEASIGWEQWSRLFCQVYGDNGPIGVAYVFVSLFKDVITKVTKCPLLYCYGSKGSGKSDFAESLMWLFFSGKNSDGKMIQGYNLNPGQGTPFSFFSRLERFRNCPMVFNEFDENHIEDWKFGTLKAAYDGEGREVGEGETGKKRKTKVQKVQGTLIVVGQYLSTRDDGSVLSRSVTCQMNLERMKSLTTEDQEAHRTLKRAEEAGLSGLVAELLQHRAHFKKEIDAEFWKQRQRLIDELRKMKIRSEERIVKNYALLLACSAVMRQVIDLPFSDQQMFAVCFDIVSKHTALLQDNNGLTTFWKIVADMQSIGLVQYGKFYDVDMRAKVTLVENREPVVKRFNSPKNLLFIRPSAIIGMYQKEAKQRGTTAMNEATILSYMKDQPYYIGMCAHHTFKLGANTDPHSGNVETVAVRTSAHVLDYDMLDIELKPAERYFGNPIEGEDGELDFSVVSEKDEKEPDDLPF